MIDEIANFVETLPESYHTEGIRPGKGLHILIDIDEKGQPVESTYRSFLVTREGEVQSLDKEGRLCSVDEPFNFSEREYYSGVSSMNKAVDTKNKKIHSSSPYVIWFKTKRPTKERISEDDWKAMSKGEKLDRLIKPGVINDYFDKLLEDESLSVNERALIENIKEFSSRQLLDLVRTDTILNLKNKKEKDVVDDDDYIKVYFNVPMEKIKMAYDRYIKRKVFNKDDYNTPDNEYGLSDFLNGAPEQKKPFVLHQTTFFKVNNRIHYTKALRLELFRKLLANGKLPNPVPVFIDDRELNERVVQLYKGNGKTVLSFHGIMKQLFEERKRDLSNYYLINWKKTRDGIEIMDFDFVSLFRYKLENYRFHNLIRLGQDILPSSYEISNIFDFESKIIPIIFNNTVVSGKDGNEQRYHYFDDIKPSSYVTFVCYQNVLKYRRSFYDFVYKSRGDAVTGKMFYDLMVSGILDDIKHDKRESSIEKLNVLFSLNRNFDPTNKNFGGIDMPSTIPQLQERLRQILGSDDDLHIASDEEFGFAAGQLIYYILNQSEASKKRLNLLEPYLRKSDAELFKTAIARGIEQYKHNLPLGYQKFQKVASEVLGYKPVKSIKDILPVLLAGFFSNCLLFEKQQKQ